MAAAGEGFYSATEFDFRSIPDAMLADCIEAGRACIAADERNKTVLYLLWRGLAAYVLWNGRRYFFGCASLTSQDPDEGLRAYDHLVADGRAHPDLFLAPLPGYECVPRSHVPAPPGSPVPEVHIPTLFRTYLRYGAKICGPPTIDRYFGTIDFLVCLDVGALPRSTFEMFARGLPGLDS
jgi:putative hemolysin